MGHLKGQRYFNSLTILIMYPCSKPRYGTKEKRSLNLATNYIADINK